MANARVQSVRARIRELGLRVTPQRLAVVETVLGSLSHPTAQEVFVQLRERYPTMSLATVYKALHLLESLGEAVPLVTESGVTRYDGDTSPHVHLVCSACGAVDDWQGSLAVGPVAEAQTQGWIVSRWRLEIAGTCPACHKGADSL